MAHPLLNFSNSQESTGDDFICTECGEGFSQYTKLINHMSIHGPMGPFSANDESGNNGCDKPIEFVLHDNGTLTMVDRAAISNFSFLFGKPTTKPVWNQITIQDSLPPNKTADKEFTCCRCERCGQVFKNQRSLQQHQRYRPLEQGFKCTLCCKDFYDRESLRNHLQFHANERFYSCGHCGKRFLKKDSLSLHQKEWHETLGPKKKIEEENDLDKSYPCKMCGLRFFWLSDLQSHLINHSHVRRSTDNSTQKENKQEQDESSRKNVSLPDGCADRSYRCGLCGGRFATLSDLKDHHVSEHPDETCAEDTSESAPPVRRHSYNNIGIMRQMVSKHQIPRLDPLRPRMRGRPRGGGRNGHNSKLYPCKQCHRVFVHSSSLSRHMRYHKGTLHTCPYCGRHFPQRCDVTRHVAMYHDVQLKTENEMFDHEDADTLKMQTSNDSEEGHPELEDQPSSKVADNEPLGGTQDTSMFKPRSSYQCRDCGRVFGLLSVYQRHIRYHRRDPSRVLLSCPRCPCRFSFYSALDRHLENHDKESSEKAVQKGFPAIEASKDLENENLNVEMGLSEANPKQRPSEVLYECTECTHTFSDLQVFLQHQSAHH